jgi:type IV secretory pathway VirJ component
MHYLSRMQTTENLSHSEVSEMIQKVQDSLIKNESNAYACGYFTGIVQGLCLLYPEIRTSVVKIISSQVNQENK